MDDLDAPEVLALTSPELVDVRIDFGIARAEVASEVIAQQTAELWSAIADVLEDAERHPEVFVDERARLDVRERRDYAARSAVADLAVRLSMAEATVRAWGDAARSLRSSAPQTWGAFRRGSISAANARAIADVLAELPSDRHAAFDEAVVGRASRLAPARFRAVVRAARERLHTESLTERHHRVAAVRRLQLEHDLDGMSWLSVYLPSEVAQRAVVGIDTMARGLRDVDGETRTLDQLRADVAGDLLLGLTSGFEPGVSTGIRTIVSVAVTVPVLTLLGASDDPGTLEGVGPIDPDTARRLAADAPSFTRILTHPVTGTVLALDRTTYRVPTDLARALRHRDRTCRFAGCGRRAARADIDHVVEWQDGGSTDASNLIHLCRHHHRLKSVSRWHAIPPDPGSASVVWRSPTGATIEAEQPPY